MPSLTKVKGIGISMICIILMAFILINPQLFFTGDPTAWQDVIFIYILLFLIAAKDNDPKSKTDDKILSDPLHYILITAAVLIGVSFIGITCTEIQPAFTGWVTAAVYTFAIVAFVETRVFICWLPEKVGITAASILFGLFHVGVYLSLLVVDIIPALVIAMIANYILYMVFIYARSIYLVMLIHTAINLAVWGYLCMV